MAEPVLNEHDLDPLAGLPDDHPRRLLVDAAIRHLDGATIGEVSLAAVASEAGLGRSTLYRAFPNGRDELLRAALAAEVARFWRGLAEAVAEEATLEGRLIRGLMEGVRRTEEHALLQRLVRHEAHQLAPMLDELEPVVYGLMVAYTEDLLDRFSDQLVDEVNRHEAAQYLATMILSYIGSPAGLDFGDEAAVAQLVRTQLLGGLLR
ncbi:MAG: TetR/AcrR family transcriptional regulator [Microthrixaceae bacterium]